MTLLLERPASKVIVSALADADERSLWVRERNYLGCIREHSLNLHGRPLSTSVFKRELNSLIFNECVMRIRWSPTGECDENGRQKLVRLAREDYRDYYTSLGEYWQYNLVVDADDLLRQSDQHNAPYFVS